jgi:hypothetical protein
MKKLSETHYAPHSIDSLNHFLSYGGVGEATSVT